MNLGTVLDLICPLSPAIWASVFVAIALVGAVLWRGGTVAKIKIPALVDVDLSKPIVFVGRAWLGYVAIAALLLAAPLASLQFTHQCDRCDGMPGETAWIYVGQYDPETGQFANGPYVESTQPGIKPQDIRAGSRVRLTEARRTMILDYSTFGLKRALESPFRLDGKVTYTCKMFAAGTELFVADRDVQGPSLEVRHIWLRVRLAPPGG
jgi:hypothetical protein